MEKKKELMNALALSTSVTAFTNLSKEALVIMKYAIIQLDVDISGFVFITRLYIF